VLRSWRKGDAVPISGSAEGNPQGHAWSRCGASAENGLSCFAIGPRLPSDRELSSVVWPGIRGYVLGSRQRRGVRRAHNPEVRVSDPPPAA
jgi:hypothetical protein